MSTPCPNKNLPEWKLLVNNLGEDQAYKVFIANGYEVPDSETTDSIINRREEGIRELPSDPLQLTSEELFNYKINNYTNDEISNRQGIYSEYDIQRRLLPEYRDTYNYFSRLIPVQPVIVFNNYGEISYKLDQNTINIDLSSVQSLADLSNRPFEEVLSESYLHEYMHAVTVNAIDGSQEFREELRQVLKDFVKADINNQFFDETRMGYRGEGGETYQYSLYEFAADLFSNRSFIEYLKSNKEHRSLIQRFIDVIKRLLGFDVKAPKNLYNKATDVILSNTAILTQTFQSANSNTYRYSPLIKGRRGLDAHFGVEEKYNRINLITSVINNELTALLEQGDADLKSEEEVFDSINMSEFKDRIFNILVDTQDRMLEADVDDTTVDSYLKVLDYFEDFEEAGVVYTGLFKQALSQLSGKGIKFREVLVDEGLTATDARLNPDAEDQIVTEGDRTTDTNWSQSSLEKDYKDTISTKVRQALRNLNVLEYQYIKDDSGNEVKVVKPVVDDLSFPVKVISNEGRWFKMIQDTVKDSITYTSMMEKLHKLAESQPTIGELIKLLDFDADLAGSFFYSFAKAKVDYISVKKFTQVDSVPGEKGVIEYNRFRVLSSNRNNIYSEIINKWSSNLKTIDGNNVSVLVKGNSVIDTDKASLLFNEYDSYLKNISDNFEFKDAATLSTLINQFGIDIDPVDIMSQFVSSKYYSEGTIYSRSPVQTVKAYLGDFKIILRDISKGNNPFDTESDWKGVVRNIVMTTATSRSDMLNDNFLNADNKPMYSYITPSYLTKTFSMLKSNNYQQLLDKYADDPFYKNSWLLSELSEGNNRDLLKFKIFDGLFNNPNRPKGDRYTGIEDRDLEIVKFNTFLNPVSDGKGSKEGTTAQYMFPILSDAPNGVFIEYKKFEPGEIIENMFTVFQQERDRINSAIDTREQYNKLEGEEKKRFAKQFIIKNYHSKKISDPMNIKFDGNAFNFVFLPFLNDSDINTNDDSVVKQAIENYLDAEVSRTIDKFRELDIWDTSDRLKSDYDLNSVDKMGGEEAAIKKYIYNSTFMNAQITQFFAGDLAFYKTDKNGIVSTDVLKRVKEVWSPASLLNTSDSEGVGDTYTTVYVSDIEKKSEFLRELENGLKMDSTLPVELRRSIISAYNKGRDSETGEELSGNNIADAQTYITLDRYVKILKSKGAWSTKHEEALKRINKGKELPEDIMIFMTPIKPFMFGQYKVGNKVVPIQNKNSEVPLLPRFVAMSPTLKSISDYMKENNIDSFSFNSVVKVGEYGTTTLNDDISNLGELQKITLSNIYYGIQQEVPAKFLDKKVLFGTQIRRLILSGINFDGTYTINGKEMTGSEVYDLYHNLISQSVISGYEQASRNFLDSDGNLNYPALQKTLLNETYTRGLSSQVIDALELVDDPDTGKKRFKVNLSHPAYSHIFESLLNSIFKNAVIKQKIKGGGMVQISAFGFSDQVKPVRAEDGRIVAAEVLMPAHTKRFFKGAINPDGTVNMDKVDPSALEGLGYRIPTEDKYSMLPFIIKGFLPVEMGSSIILPEEITTQTGSDFDIDKMFIMLYELEEKDGKLTKIVPEDSLVGLSESARNNTLIDIMRGVLLNPNSITDELAPGGFSLLQEIANEIKSYYESDQQYDYILPSTQTNFFNRAKSAAGLIGIFANHNVNHVITTLGDVRFVGDVVQGEDTSSFISGYIIRPNGQRIKVTKVLGSNVAAAVDAIKDPIFNFININDATVNQYVTLERVGIDPDRALFFINNPIIREFARLKLDFRLISERAITDLSSAYSSVYKTVSKQDEVSVEGNPFDLNKIKKSLNFYKNNKDRINEVFNMNPEERANVSYDKEFSEYLIHQLATLYSFQSISYSAEDLSNFINITRTESGGVGPSIFNNIDKINRIVNFYNGNNTLSLSTTVPILRDTILAINNLYPDTLNEGVIDEATSSEKTFPFVDAFTKYGLVKPTEVLYNIFPYDSNLFRNILYAAKTVTADDIRKVYAGYTTYSLSKMRFLDDTDPSRLTEMFMGSNNIANRFVDIRKRFPDLGNSLLFRKITPIFADDTNKINYLKFDNTVKLLSYEKDLVTADWERLLIYEDEEVRIFGEDLIRNSFYTTGYTYSGTAMYNFIPNGVYESQGANRILDDAFPHGMEDTTVEPVYDFLYQYYRNELNNDDSLIPRIFEAEDIKRQGTVITEFKSKGVESYDDFVSFTEGSSKNLYFAIDAFSYEKDRQSLFDVTYIRIPSTNKGMRYYNFRESFLDVLTKVTPEEFQDQIGPRINTMQEMIEAANRCGV